MTTADRLKSRLTMAFALSAIVSAIVYARPDVLPARTGAPIVIDTSEENVR